jgi:hypothetical protein
MLRTDGPNLLTSGSEDFNEVNPLPYEHNPNGGRERQPLADHGHALYNRIFRTLSQGIDIVESARLFAMENLAADAAIAAGTTTPLAVLAPDHGDSRGRYRRQPATKPT